MRVMMTCRRELMRPQLYVDRDNFDESHCFLVRFDPASRRRLERTIWKIYSTSPGKLIRFGAFSDPDEWMTCSLSMALNP